MTKTETMKGNRVPPHMSKNLDYEALKELVRHHIESFDHMVEYGLDTMLKNIKPAEVYDSISNKKLRNILFFLILVSSHFIHIFVHSSSLCLVLWFVYSF